MEYFFLSIIKINICQSTLEDDEVERVKNGAEDWLIPVILVAKFPFSFTRYLSSTSKSLDIFFISQSSNFWSVLTLEANACSDRPGSTLSTIVPRKGEGPVTLRAHTIHTSTGNSFNVRTTSSWNRPFKHFPLTCKWHNQVYLENFYKKKLLYY